MRPSVRVQKVLEQFAIVAVNDALMLVQDPHLARPLHSYDEDGPFGPNGDCPRPVTVNRLNGGNRAAAKATREGHGVVSVAVSRDASAEYDVLLQEVERRVEHIDPTASPAAGACPLAVRGQDEVLGLVLVLVARQVELASLQSVNIQNRGVSLPLPCCNREVRPLLDPGSRQRRNALAKDVLRLKLVARGAFLLRVRLDPLGSWPTEGPERFVLLVDDLDAPPRPADAAPDSRTATPGGIDQGLAAVAGRRPSGPGERLQLLRNPAHPDAHVRSNPVLSLVNEVSVESHEAKPVNVRLDVERRRVVFSPGDGHGHVAVEAAVPWILISDDAGHGPMIA